MPYIRIIQQVIPPGSRFYLQTLEKEKFSLSPPRAQAAKAALEGENITWLPLTYRPFGVVAMAGYCMQVAKLAFFVRRNDIRFLHPFAAGAGALAFFIQRLTATRIVFDSWEPHAESMVESGVWKRDSIAFTLLWHIEKQLAIRSYYLIAASGQMPHYALAKWDVKPPNICYRPACVDMTLFDPSLFSKQQSREFLGINASVVCVSTGKIGGMYLAEELFIFMKYAHDFFGGDFCALILTETAIEEVNKLAAMAGFPLNKLVTRSISHADVPFHLAAADFAFNPQKPLPSKRFGTPVKDGEYWAMGLPVVLFPEISEDSAVVIEMQAGVLIHEISSSGCADTLNNMQSLLDDPGTSTRCREAARRYRSFDLAVKAYTEVYGDAGNQMLEARR